MNATELDKKFGIPGFVSIVDVDGLAPKVIVTLICGTKVEIHTYGAQITSWVVSGKERLFLSKTANYQRGKAIRGGIPICWPQFGPGSLPQHGFVRTCVFNLIDVTMELKDSEETRKLWNHSFTLTLTATIREHTLSTVFTVVNTGTAPFEFTTALHTYFAIDHIQQTEIIGLSGLRYFDKVSNCPRTDTSSTVTFSGETDRVYYSAPDRLEIVSASSKDVIYAVYKTGFPDVVVWNPFEQRQKTMPDLDTWEGFVCLEVAAVEQPIRLAPSESWSGSQLLHPR